MEIMQNLTVERLRKMNDIEVLMDNDKLEWTVSNIWDRLEREDFDNDNQRNEWLYNKGFMI